MKKFLSLVLCLALVLALGAFVFADSASTAKLEITKDTGTVNADSTAKTWEGNGIKFTIEKMSGTLSTTHDIVRIQPKNRLTVEYPNMKSISFTTSEAKYAQKIQLALSQYKDLNVAINDAVVTVTFAGPQNVFSFLMSDSATNITRGDLKAIEVTSFTAGEETGAVKTAKTITIMDKTLTTTTYGWAYNEAGMFADAAARSSYELMIFDKKYEGDVYATKMGVAIVVDKNGAIVRIYDSTGRLFDEYNVVPSGGSIAAVEPTFTGAEYCKIAFDSLEKDETLIIFNYAINDGGSFATFYNTGLNLRLKENIIGQKVTITGFTFGEEEKPVEPSTPATEPSTPATEPSTPATEPGTPATEPGTPGTPVDPNGDNTFVVIAMVILSMTALVVLVSKKRAF